VTVSQEGGVIYLTTPLGIPNYLKNKKHSIPNKDTTHNSINCCPEESKQTPP
jgi:hypothetical protein